MYNIEHFVEAKSIQEAIHLLCQYENALPVCGGTDVFVALRTQHNTKPPVLVGISEIEALHGITLDEKGDLHIGAACTMSTLLENPLVSEKVPALRAALAKVGSLQVRNVASLGGNLCGGVVSADSAPALLVYDAILHFEDKHGTSEMPLHEFYLAPSKTKLKKGQILTSITLPLSGYQGRQTAIQKFAQRKAMDVAIMGCAVSVKKAKEGDCVSEMCIAFGVAGPTPRRCFETEAKLRGKPISYIKENMASFLLEELSPIACWRANLAVRRQLIQALANRCFKNALAEKGGEESC